jgi:hypothetical protein
MSLLRSRKFWIAVFGLLAVIYTSATGQEFMSMETQEAIVKIVLVLIGSIAVEDAATKLRQ